MSEHPAGELTPEREAEIRTLIPKRSFAAPDYAQAAIDLLAALDACRAGLAEAVAVNNRNTPKYIKACEDRDSWRERALRAEDWLNKRGISFEETTNDH